MQNFGNRLKTFRIFRGYTQKELGSKVGVTEVTVGNWERNIKLPNLCKLYALCDALDTSPNAMMNVCGNDDFLETVTPNERRLIIRYRDLDPISKTAIDTLCDIELGRTKSNSRDSCSSEKSIQFEHVLRQIPLYATPSAAGIAVPLEGEDYEMISIRQSFLHDPDFAVRIQGDSMSPYICDGDIVYVNKGLELINGDVGIFSVDGAMYCKQYFRDQKGNVYLLSANPDRTDANIYLNHDSGSTLHLCGKVLIDKLPIPEYFSL